MGIDLQWIDWKIVRKSGHQHLLGDIAAEIHQQLSRMSSTPQVFPDASRKTFNHERPPETPGTQTQGEADNRLTMQTLS